MPSFPKKFGRAAQPESALARPGEELSGPPLPYTARASLQERRKSAIFHGERKFTFLAECKIADIAGLGPFSIVWPVHPRFTD